jgi:hypothetical protein
MKDVSMPVFTLHCNYDRIWNLSEFVGFLNQHQQQDVTLNLNPEAPDLEVAGVYDILRHFKFASVTINTCNPFESHDLYNVRLQPGNVFLSHTPIVNQSIHQWNGKKVFLTLFGRPTAARLAIAAHLFCLHRGLSHIHFNSLPNDDNIGLFEFDKLAQYEKTSLSLAAELLKHLPLTIMPTEYTDFIRENINTQGIIWVEKIINNPLTECYRDIFVDCVSESHVLGRTFFPTEKTTRPMWCKKPFIMFGSRDYLLYLRQMGFQTFYQFWDEDYDGYEGRDRLSRILKLIDWLGSQSIATLENMYQDMQPILEHNYNLLLTQTYTSTVSEVT